MIDVRLRPEGFEGRCEACKEWWPVERQFWHTNSGLRRCRACVLERRRGATARRQRRTPITPELRAYKRDWMRRWRRQQADIEHAA